MSGCNNSKCVIVIRLKRRRVNITDCFSHRRVKRDALKNMQFHFVDGWLRHMYSKKGYQSVWNIRLIILHPYNRDKYLGGLL